VGGKARTPNATAGHVCFVLGARGGERGLQWQQCAVVLAPHRRLLGAMPVQHTPASEGGGGISSPPLAAAAARWLARGCITPSACRAVQGGWCVLLQGAGRGGSKVAVVDKGHTALWTGAGLWLRLYAYHTTSCRGLMYWRAPLLGAVLRQAVPWRQLPGAVLG
jgi:hypothetical protein